MRWLVTLQVAVGLGALFGLAYKSVDGVVGPVTSAYALTAAQAEARAASADLSIAWQGALGAQEQVVRNLAATEALSTVGAIFGRADRTRGLELALEAVVAQAGGEGRAAVLGLDSAPIVDSEGAPLLAGTRAAQAALSGATVVRLELIEGQPQVVAAAPLHMKGDLQGALVVATPLDTARLRAWTQVLPAGTWVAVALDGKAVVSTAPQGSMASAVGADPVVDINGEPFAAAGRASSGGETVQVLGYSPVKSDGAQAAVQRVELLVLVLGGLAFLLVAVLLMVRPDPGSEPKETAPGPSVDLQAPLPLAPVPPALAPAPAPAPALALEFPSRPSPSSGHQRPTGTGDMSGLPSMPEGALPLDQAFAQKTVPSHPAPAVAPAPSEVPGGSPSQDLKAPVGGEMSPFARPTGPGLAAPAPVYAPPPAFAPVYAPPPALAPSPISPSPDFSSRPSAIMTNPPPTPAPSPAPRAPLRPPPAASPFDAIASAAVSRPPPSTSRPSVSQRGPDADNLPAPKGGVPPEMIAAERAEQQRAAHGRAPEPHPAGFAASPYDPELPAPKGPMHPGRSAATGLPVPSPATEPPRQPPGVTQAPEPAIPLPGGTPPSKDPWRNPSVPAMNAPASRSGPAANTQFPVNAPTSPPSSTMPAASAVIAPYDEAHYRSVYNEFVSSKAELGEAVDNITYDGFRAKLRSSEQQLLERHSCRAVRFQVLVRDRTVSLRPQLLR